MARDRQAEAVVIKTAEEIAIMREAGRIVARAHQALREAVRPGVTTLELDRIAEAVIRDHGAEPVFKGYPKPGAPDFPGTITASVNEELIHGIPSAKRVLKDGDLISLDCGCTYQGFVGDAAFSMAVGEASKAVQRLLEVTEQALYVAIDKARLPQHTSDIALAVFRYVSDHGYSVEQAYTGHGVGRSMHEAPEIPNWWPRDAARRGWRSYPLQVGMTFAIEPMVIAGRPDTRELEDGWTVVSRDRSLCAHFEHTVCITDGDPIILTAL